MSNIRLSSTLSSQSKQESRYVKVQQAFRFWVKVRLNDRIISPRRSSVLLLLARTVVGGAEVQLRRVPRISKDEEMNAIVKRMAWVVYNVRAYHYEGSPCMQGRSWNNRSRPNRRFVPLNCNAIVDLVERQGNYDEAKECVEIVLGRTSSSHKGRCFCKVNDDSESELE